MTTLRRSRASYWFPLVCVLVSLVCDAPGVSAHRGSAKRISVERTGEGAEIEVELEAVDVAVELGLGETATVSEIMERSAAIRAWVSDGLTLRVDGRPCATSADAPGRRERDGERIVVHLTARCGTSAAGSVRLRDDMIFDDDPQHEAFVRLRWVGGDDAYVLRAGRQELDLGQPPRLPDLLGRFVWEGMIHLVTGYDHLLFLLSLVLTAGGLGAREGMKTALKDVALIVTAFTLGHSVTLVAAALDIVVLPSRLVESAIAASIIVVAVLNAIRPRARRSMPWLAFGFGLIHGFGFSGVLAELGLPTQARVACLVAFNVGIELAQLGFVAVLLFPLARAAERPAYERRFVPLASGLIGLVASVWLVERVLG